MFLDVGVKINDYTLSELLRGANVTKDASVVTLEQFKTMVEMHFKKIDLKQELIDTFKIFDKPDAGKLKAEEFKAILAEMGISQAEIDDFIENAKVDKKGEIDYAAMAKRFAEGEPAPKVDPKKTLSTRSKK